MNRLFNAKQMNGFLLRLKSELTSRKSSGMELVQVAILIAIAIAIGLIFRERINLFINRVLGGLNDF